MGGRSAKQKGNRVERKLVTLHKAAGVLAERIPLSGAAGGTFSGDLNIYLFGGDPAKGEVKARRTGAGWTTIKKWLGENDLLFLVEDCQDPLVVMPWSVYKELIKESDDTAIRTAGPEDSGEDTYGDY